MPVSHCAITGEDASGASAASGTTTSQVVDWERRARLAEAEVQRLSLTLRELAPDVLDDPAEVARLRYDHNQTVF